MSFRAQRGIAPCKYGPDEILRGLRLLRLTTFGAFSVPGQPEALAAFFRTQVSMRSNAFRIFSTELANENRR